MPACKLVIFDNDGTLMDTEHIASAVEVEMLAELGIEMSAEEFAARFAGTTGPEARATMAAEAGRELPDDFGAKVHEKMQERMWREAQVVAGAHEMLDRIDQPRCVCSNASADELKLKLTKGQLWDRFRPYIYSAVSIEGVRPKPAPDVFLHAARELDVEPHECIVVEDSVPGVTAAVAAGMRVIGFNGASHARPEDADALTEAGAVTVLNRLSLLPETIAALEAFDPAEI